MTGVLARYLLPSETCVAIVRRHWAVLIPQGSAVAATWIVWAVVLDASVSPFVQTIAAFFYLFSASWFGWLLAEWHSEQFVVTDKRVLLITGLLYRRLAVMPLAKVTDLTYQRSPLGRMLGYGTFIMESAGQDQALSRVDYLRSSDRLYQRLSQQMFGPGGRDAEDGPLGPSWLPRFPSRPSPPTPPAPPQAVHPTYPTPEPPHPAQMPGSPAPPGRSGAPGSPGPSGPPGLSVAVDESEPTRRTMRLPRLR